MIKNLLWGLNLGNPEAQSKLSGPSLVIQNRNHVDQLNTEKRTIACVTVWDQFAIFKNQLRTPTLKRNTLESKSKTSE